MSRGRTSVAVLLVLGGLALPASAGAADPPSKTEYLQSGQYARDVVAAAAPATAWITTRGDQVATLAAACHAYGLPLGADGKATTPTVTDATPAQLAAAASTATAATRAERRAKAAKTSSKRLARKHGATRRARAAARKRAARLARTARAARAKATAAAAAATRTPARPAASACRSAIRPAIVLDIDETALSNYIGVPGADPEAGSVGQFPAALAGTGTRMPGVYEAYRAARAAGMAVFFITARPLLLPGLQDTTIRNLHAAGYEAWDGLSLKPDPFASSATYKTAERAKVQASGYTIVANLGDQDSDLVGGYSERTFKLPNPFYTG